MSETIPAPWADWWALHRNVNTATQPEEFPNISANLNVMINGESVMSSLADYIRIADVVSTSIGEVTFELERKVIARDSAAMTWRIDIPQDAQGREPETTFGVAVLNAAEGQVVEVKFYFNSPRFRSLLSSTDRSRENSNVTPIRTQQVKWA